jgi:hypothetical protein
MFRQNQNENLKHQPLWTYLYIASKIFILILPKLKELKRKENETNPISKLLLLFTFLKTCFSLAFAFYKNCLIFHDSNLLIVQKYAFNKVF